MIYEGKNLSQEQFLQFYYSYIHSVTPVALAEWIIRILPEDVVLKMVGGEEK